MFISGFLRSWKSAGILTLLENSWNSAEIYIFLENHPGILMFLE
jgi:hypothetical protein